MKKYLKIYYKEVICILYILMVSLYNLKKASYLKTEYSTFFYKELIWIIVGITFYVLTYKIKFNKIFNLRYILYFLNILLLIYPLLFSKSINGTKAWINIFGLTVQPSELIKITYPLIAIYLVRQKKYFLTTVLYLIPSILILLEPDTGNFILLSIIFIFILYSKKNKKILLSLLFLIFSIFTLSVITFKYKPEIFIKLFNGKLYYRYKRIFNYNNLQIENALISISRIKLLPMHYKKINIYIPEGATDFMFSFLAPNIGYIFLVPLLLSYLYLIVSFIKRYFIRRYYYQKKLIGTFLIVFTVQVVYNILMNIGILPIMGIPLPFISYGGSNIISYFILLSLATKKITPIVDKDNYKNNFRMVQMDK